MSVLRLHRKSIAISMGALLLTLLAAAWLVPWSMSSDRETRGLANEGESAHRHPVDNRPVAWGMSAKEEGKSAASSPEPLPDQPMPALNRRRVVLRFQDEAGGAVMHWRFRYTIFDMAGQVGQLDLPVEQRGKPAERCTLEGVSSQAGTFEICGEASTMAAILLCPVNPGLAFSSPGDTGGSLAPNECAYHVLGEDRDIAVVLRVSNCIAFTIVYADGQPFEGEAGISFSGKGVDSSMSRQLLAAGQDISVDLPNGVAEVQVGAQHNRVGFNAFPQWRFRFPDIPAYRKLVIDADPHQINIIVHLNGWERDESVDCIVFSANGSPMVEGKSLGGETWHTVRAINTGGEYVVQVSGRSGVWRSPFFELELGKTYEFDATAAVAGRLRARFVDTGGSPLPNSVMHLRKTAYPDWHHRRNYRTEQEVVRAFGFGASAGYSGVAELEGMPPGEVTVFLESFGHEVEVHKAVIRSGETTDLGEVTMQPAKGRIELNLINRNPDYDYYIWLMHPNARGIIAIEKRVKRDQIIFDQLPVREYLLRINARNGSPGRNIKIIFDADAKCILNEDVSDLVIRDDR